MAASKAADELAIASVSIQVNCMIRLELTEDVKSFLRYNGNKALANLGFEPFIADITTIICLALLALNITKDIYLLPFCQIND